MIKGNEDYQRLSMDAEPIKRLSTLLNADKRENQMDCDYLSSPANYKLKRVSLECIAAISSDLEECRELVIEAKLFQGKNSLFL